MFIIRYKNRLFLSVLLCDDKYTYVNKLPVPMYTMNAIGSLRDKTNNAVKLNGLK